MGKRVRYDNMTGGLNTVSALGTINQSPRRTESPDCYNVEYFKLGGIKSMEGNEQFSSVLTAGVSCGLEYRKDNFKYMMVASKDGKVWVHNGISNSFDVVYTFPTATDRHSMVSFMNGVVISNGVDDLIFYEKGRNTLLTGSVSITVGTKDVTGVGSKFKTELAVGDYIKFDGDTGYYVIDEITTDTAMKVKANATQTFTNTYYRLGELSLCNATLKNTDDPSIALPIRGLALQVYRGRLFVGGNDDNLYYSELNKYNGWDIKYKAGSFPPFYNDTSNILALGLYTEYLLIHRQNFTYMLSGDNSPESWAIAPFADISCESQQSYVSANNAYYVFSRKNAGIYPLMKRTIFSDKFVGDELSTKIRNLFDVLNYSELDNIYCVSVPKKKYIMFYMPMLNGVGSNCAYIFDLQTNSWLIRVVPQNVTAVFRYNDRVYIGTSTGKILEEFKGLTFDGYKIQFSWKTPWLDFGDGSSYMSTREFRVQIAEDYNNNFYLKNRRDGLDGYTKRLVKNTSGTKQSLFWSNDAGNITDTVWDDYEWVETGFTTTRFPLENQCFQNMQIEFCGEVENQGMAVYGWELLGIEREEEPWN